jgi:hypothetical protein
MAEVPAARVRHDAGQLITMSAIPAAVAALARLNVFQALAQADQTYYWRLPSSRRWRCRGNRSPYLTWRVCCV